MADTKVETTNKRLTTLLTNKKTRSTILLAISFIIVLALNSVLPVIQGDAHYTVEAVETSYSEYINMRDANPNYRLTWLSEQQINTYIRKYTEAHPELTEDEKLLISVPANFKVKVYTKFFYQYTFWYISTITSLSSSVILFYSVFNYLITKAKGEYKKYVDLTTEMDNIANNYLDPVTFEPWMDDVFNRKRKIKQHKSNVKYKIDKLERWTPYKVKRVFRDYYKYKNNPDKFQDVHIDFDKLKWRERHYFNKKEKLLDLLEDSYINEYVVNGKVKYFRYIYPMFVSNGTNAVGRTVDSYSLIKSDTGRITSDAGSKITMSIVMTVLFAVLITVTAVASYQQSLFWIIVNVVAKIAPLLMQIPLAIDYSNTFMDTQLLDNLISRRSISLLYLADMRNTGNNAKVALDKNLQEAIDKEVEKNAKEN